MSVFGYYQAIVKDFKWMMVLNKFIYFVTSVGRSLGINCSLSYTALVLWKSTGWNNRVTSVRLAHSYKKTTKKGKLTSDYCLHTSDEDSPGVATWWLNCDWTDLRWLGLTQKRKLVFTVQCRRPAYKPMRVAEIFCAWLLIQHKSQTRVVTDQDN